VYRVHFDFIINQKTVIQVLHIIFTHAQKQKPSAIPINQQIIGSKLNQSVKEKGKRHKNK
jgi:hypothetical protein